MHKFNVYIVQCVCVSVSVSESVCVSVCLCLCVHVCVYMCILYMYMYIHIHLLTQKSYRDRDSNHPQNGDQSLQSIYQQFLITMPRYVHSIHDYMYM